MDNIRAKYLKFIDKRVINIEYNVSLRFFVNCYLQVRYRGIFSGKHLR